MIRPVTCIAFLLACGSGLYLYQAKHRVKLLDDRIAAIAKSTDTLREQTRMLSAEWTLLNDPERLRTLANQFLALQTVAPNQFTSLADLDSRLPAPLPQGAPPAPSEAAPVVAQQVPPAGAPDQAALPTLASVAEAKPAPAPANADTGTPAGAITAASVAASGGTATAATSPTDIASGAPKPAQTAVAAAKPAADTRHPARDAVAARIAIAAAQARADDRHATAHPPRIAAVQPRPIEHRPIERPVDRQEVAQRVFVPRVVERRPVMAGPAMPASGSFLGMAHDMAAPPAPMPMQRPALPEPTPYTYSAAGG